MSWGNLYPELDAQIPYTLHGRNKGFKEEGFPESEANLVKWHEKKAGWHTVWQGANPTPFSAIAYLSEGPELKLLFP